IGQIDGNLATGLILHDVIISESGQQVLAASRIEVRYDPVAFFLKRVAISHATIVNPDIHIWRTKSGLFNIDRLFVKTNPDTTPSAWTIDIKNIELTNARLEFIDSLRLSWRESGITEYPPAGVIDYARVRLDSVQLNASLLLKPGSVKARIRLFSFHSPVPEFTLTDLRGDFLLTKSEASIRNLFINTKNTHLRLGASVKNIDLASLGNLRELEKTPVDLHLTADPIDTHELKQFLFPWIDFLDNALSFQIDCSGKFSALSVEQVHLHTDKTDIRIKGEINNLHIPEHLELHLNADNAVLHTEDIKRLVPGLHFPDLTYLGKVSTSFEFNGRPADFHAVINASTAVGDVTGDAKLNFTRGNFTYDGVFNGAHIALGTIIDAKNISSDINARITVNGEGTDPQTMTGVAKLEIDSSLFNGLHCEKTVCVANIADGLLRSRLTAAIGSGNYELSATAQFQENSAVHYGMKGRVISLDLGEILQDHSFNSDLSFQISEDGTSAPHLQRDSLRVDFLRSSFKERQFDSGNLSVLFGNVDNAYQHLRLNSDIADLSLNGQFSLASLIEACTNAGKLVGQYFSYRVQTLDSLRAKTSIRNSRILTPAVTALSAPINAQFNLVWRNLSPLGWVLDVPMEGDLSVKGTLTAVGDRYDCSGHIAANEFGGRFSDDTINANLFTAQYDIGNLNARTFSPQCSVVLQVQANSLQYNTFEFDRPLIEMAVSPDSGRFAIGTLIDSTTQVNLQGTFTERSRVLEFEIPVMQMIFDSLYALNNTQPVLFTLGQDGFFIRSWTMAHDTEDIQLAGFFNPNGISDASVSVSSFSLTSLPHVVHRLRTAGFNYNGTVRASGSLKGTFEDPIFIVGLAADNVEAKNIRLGHIEARASYSKHMLDLLAFFASKPEISNAEPDLLLSGTIPYDLSLRKESPFKLEGQMNLTLRSKGLSMIFLAPFLPVIEDLSGTLLCDMKMKGTIDMPEYEGTISIQNAAFLFIPLQLRYTLSGQLVPDGIRMRLQNVTIRNAPESGVSGSQMQLGGYLTLHGLSLSGFDLTANGQMLIMDEAHRIPNQKFYGTLFAATDKNGVHWKGNAAHSNVNGQLFLQDAAIILPPERESEAARVSTIAVTFKDDTSRVIENPSEIVKNKLLKSQKLALSNASRTIDESFLDHIDYDLIVETQGSTTLRFVFNTQTSEELFADLNGRVTYNKIGNISRFIGEVSLGDRSYYNFFKKFDATGKISFTGDVLNPELNVVARYEGLHKVDTSQTNANEKIAVILSITGTRMAPSIKTELDTYDNTSKSWTKRQSGNEESDALSFIISGQFSSEITGQQRASLLGTNMGLGLATNMIAGTLSESLRRNTYGYVQSVDVLYYGGQFDKSADVRLTGQVGEAVIKYGGRVIDDPIGNANVSVEYPIKFITRNLLISYERKVEGLENTNEQRTSYNSAKIFYRISF
ncbi:MAG: hypothetical protein WAV76_04720, partial [Bacteroidota bacterium]